MKKIKLYLKIMDSWLQNQRHLLKNKKIILCKLKKNNIKMKKSNKDMIIKWWIIKEWSKYVSHLKTWIMNLKLTLKRRNKNLKINKDLTMRKINLKLVHILISCDVIYIHLLFLVYIFIKLLASDLLPVILILCFIIQVFLINYFNTHYIIL